MKFLKPITITFLIFCASIAMAQKKGMDATKDEPCPLPKYKKGQTSAEVNRETMDYVMCQRLKKEKKDKETADRNKQRSIEQAQRKSAQDAEKQRRIDESKKDEQAAADRQRLARESNTNRTPRATPQRRDPHKDAQQRAREERQRLAREERAEAARKKRAADGN